MTTQKLVKLSLLLAIAIVIHYFESVIMFTSIIPGFKLGFANIIGIIVLSLYDYKSMVIVNILRVVLTSLIRGSLFSISMVIPLFSVIFSMLLCYKIYKRNVLSIYGISMLQALFFNIGQIIIICLIYQNLIFMYYLPYLLIIGMITGFIIAYISIRILKRIKIAI